MPGHQVNFIHFQDTGTARLTKRGGLLARQENSVIVEEVERGLDLDVLDLLQSVAKGDNCDYQQEQGRYIAGRLPADNHSKN
jgi:hypothetical protein